MVGDISVPDLAGLYSGEETIERERYTRSETLPSISVMSRTLTKVNLIIFLSLLLLSCGMVAPTESRPIEGAIASNQSENRGQMLPITARAYINNQSIDLEVARTDQQQAMGLMFRTSQPRDRGMLFPFAEARPVGFWMKNVVIPLDMIFLRDGIVQEVFVNVPPCQSDRCPVYGPRTPIDSVIELAGGRAKELGIKVGDKIQIEPIAPDSSGKP
jgi:uncharacterized membrane protein (UPF0127 family)